MNICFLSYRFPGLHNKTDFVFVKKLVDEIARMGNHCYVLSPYNILYYRKRFERKESYAVGRGSVTVYRPLYLSFSNLHIGSFFLSTFLYKQALKRAYRMMNFVPDVIYGHFWESAYNGYNFAKKNRIPLFVATGESEIRKMFNFSINLSDFRDYVRGVICVSTKNLEESVELGLTSREKCIVCPNAVDTNVFHKLDKRECRKSLGFPQDSFIIVFLGWFNDRKGVLRVSKAISQVGGVKSIFIGKGELNPDCDGILFKGTLHHDDIPLYLNAADCFVLPTLHEGCCNAVIEAMSCGLPIVSSNLPFNWDVLDTSNSILVDPNNISEIASAISRLKETPSLRNKMELAALQKSQDLTISQRAKRIIDFIESKL